MKPHSFARLQSRTVDVVSASGLVFHSVILAYSFAMRAALYIETTLR